MNLRNAAATFGTESKQYQAIHHTVYCHLHQMQASGQKTNITAAKATHSADADGLAAAFEQLDLELKAESNPTSAGDAMQG